MHPETISERRRTVRVEQGPSTYTWTITETVTHSRAVAATGDYFPPTSTPPHGLAAGPAPFQADDDIFRSPFYASHTVDDSVDLYHRAPLLYPRPLPAEDGHYVYDPARRAAVYSRQYNLSPHPRIVPGPPSAIFVPVAEENDRGPMRAGTPSHSPPRHSPSSSSQPYPSIADDWRAEAVEPRHRQSFSAPPGEPFLPPHGWVPYPEMPSRSEDRQSHCQPGYGASTDSGHQSYQPSISFDSGHPTASAGEDTPTPYSGSTSTSWVPLDGYSDPALPRPRPRPGSPAVVCLSTGEVLPSDSLPLPPSDGYIRDGYQATPARLGPDWGRRDEQWPWPPARQEYADVLECGMGGDVAESTTWTHGCVGRSN